MKDLTKQITANAGAREAAVPALARGLAWGVSARGPLLACWADRARRPSEAQRVGHGSRLGKAQMNTPRRNSIG
jgi:hypothetical protein